MDQDQLVGRTIGGRFRIEAFLGEGAMGRVYRARQIALGTTVALKVIHQNLATIPNVEARFLREAQAASRIDHPASVRVIDFGKEPDGLLYLAMEMLRGKTLAEMLLETGPLPAARIVEIASQILAALAVAHELGVVHRDLKPENIMVLEAKDDDGIACDVVKVCDFGIAKLLDAGAKAPTVTQEGVIVGTPAYMSPEQARGEALDGRSDVYAMGVLLFHMMTGEVPFDASSAMGTALMHVTDEPTKPTLLVPSVDARLEAICLKAMRKRPEERYASARELRAELRALVGGDGAFPSLAPTTLRAQVETQPGRANRVVVGAALAGAALVAAFLFGAKAKPVESADAPAAAQPVAAREPAKSVGEATPAPPAPTDEPDGVTEGTTPPPTSPHASRSPSRRAAARVVTAPLPTPAGKPGAKPVANVSARVVDPVPPVPPSNANAASPTPTAVDEPLPTFIPRPGVAPATAEAEPPPPDAIFAAPAPEPKPEPKPEAPASEPRPAAPAAPAPAIPPLPPG